MTLYLVSSLEHMGQQHGTVIIQVFWDSGMLHHVIWYTDTDILKELVLWDVTCQCVSGARSSTDMLTC